MLKNKIFKNKSILDGLKFDVELCNKIYEFKIQYISEKFIKIGIPVTFSKMGHADINSLEGIVKKTILETSANNQIPLYRQAYLSKYKLKNKEFFIDGIRFKMDYITSSKLIVQKFIDYDELLGSENGTFLGTIKKVILNNLVDNPPEPKKISSYESGYSGDVPYLFSSFSQPMHFKKLGNRKSVVSEAKIEENREKYKNQRKKDAEARKKYEELEKKLGLNKKSSTKDLARHR